MRTHFSQALIECPYVQTKKTPHNFYVQTTTTLEDAIKLRGTAILESTAALDCKATALTLCCQCSMPPMHSQVRRGIYNQRPKCVCDNILDRKIVAYVLLCFGTGSL